MDPRGPDAVLTVRCACGWQLSGREADVVPATIEHGRRLHNMEATREAVLAMAMPDESDRAAQRSPDRA